MKTVPPINPETGTKIGKGIILLSKESLQFSKEKSKKLFNYL